MNNVMIAGEKKKLKNEEKNKYANLEVDLLAK